MDYKQEHGVMTTILLLSLRGNKLHTSTKEDKSCKIMYTNLKDKPSIETKNGNYYDPEFLFKNIFEHGWVESPISGEKLG